MLDATHRIYEILNEASDEIQQSTSATHGEINIGILASIEDSVLTDFGVRYFKEHKGITITTHMLTRKEIWEKLENNTIDLAIMYLPDDSIKNWKPYKTKKIITENLLFVHQNERLAKRKKVKLKDTLDNYWVTYPPTYYLNELNKETYKNAILDEPSSVAHFATPNQIFKFVKQTGAYATLPQSFLVAHNQDNTVYTAQLEPNIQFDLDFVFRKGKDQIPRIANFLKEFDMYLSEKNYVSRLTELNKKR